MKLKRVILFLLSIAITTITFCGCGKMENQSSSLLSSEKALSNTEELDFDFSQEPPLNEYILEIPVPDFLDEEQQTLYRRAYSTANFMFVSTFFIEDYPLYQNQKSKTEINSTIKKDEYTYYEVNGRYNKWLDFENMINNIYTKEYFNKINGTSEHPYFIKYNDELYHLGAERGTNNLICEPDSFELISKNTKEIKFNVIGHYLDIHENETDEEWIARLDNGEYDYTEKYPITMVNTENGWRFSEYNITR